jgi:hypothetical protein
MKVTATRRVSCYLETLKIIEPVLGCCVVERVPPKVGKTRTV